MVIIDKLAEKVFGIMKGFGHQIRMYTSDGTETVDPKEARRFFASDDGMMVTIDEEDNEVVLSKSPQEPLEKTRKLQRNLKKLANQFLMNYTVRSYGKSIQPRDFSYQAKIQRNNNMAESKLRESDAELHALVNKTAKGPLLVSVTRSKDKHIRPGSVFKVSDIDTDGGYEPTALFTNRDGDSKRGKLYDIDFRELRMGNKQRTNEGLSKLSGSKKTSHQTLENVKILVKHRTAVDEERRGARSRNIQSIFLERDGERFRFPHNHLGGARAMARHMQEGGDMGDRVGGYIVESVSNLIKLHEFYRYAKSNKLINEDTDNIIETIRENIDGLKGELKRLTGVKTYESIRSRIEESDEMELQEDDVSTLRDMFTVKRFDEKFDDVLPVVNRLVQEKDQYFRRIEEASGSPIQVAQRAFAIDSVLEFKSDAARMGHRLSEISSRILENPELASFVSNVGRKLCKEGEINAFEKSVMNSVLGNMAPQQIQEEKTEISESKSFEKHFDKYDYLFV